MNKNKPQRTPPAQHEDETALPEFRFSFVMPVDDQNTILHVRRWSVEHRGRDGRHVFRGTTEAGAEVFAVGQVTVDPQSEYDGRGRLPLEFAVERIWVDGHRIV